MTRAEPRPIDWSAYAAVLFDLDGVITPTAEIHAKAWAELFARWDFTDADYLAYVDGRPRYDGVQAFLDSRGVELPWGDPSDPPGDDTVCAMGNRKNETFNEVLARDGISAYRGSIAVLDVLDAAGVGAAIVSSSKNARTVLQAAGITDRFQAIVDGVTASDEQLPGKPHPAMFLRAAELMSVTPAQAAVVEDAISGVEAAHAGHFALVLGIDRTGEGDALSAAGADVVVSDLGDTLSAGTR